MPIQERRPDLVAVCFVGGLAAVAGPGVRLAGGHQEITQAVARLETGRHPRWVFWSAHTDATPLVNSGIHLDRCWDIAEAHRILVGGRGAGPDVAWATVGGLATTNLPKASGNDLFDFTTENDPGIGGEGDDRDDPQRPVRSDGYLRPDAVTGAWQSSPERVLAWAEAGLDTAARQIAALSEISPRAVSTGQSESAASLLCVELAAVGLPVDRPTIEALIEASAGPRPDNEAHARQMRRQRDAEVLRHAHGRESTVCETRCRSGSSWHRSALLSPTLAPGGSNRSATPTRWWRHC